MLRAAVGRRQPAGGCDVTRSVARTPVRNGILAALLATGEFDPGQRRAPRLLSNAIMKIPNIFIAYAPRGAGLRCALAYLGSGRDVYGWYTGPRADGSIAAEFFLLEDFYSNRPARYEAVETAALHSRWSLDEARRHDLVAMQDAFAHEWLFRRDDARAASELEAYARAELAAGELNLRFERLAKLPTLQPNWTFYSPHFERSVLRHLAKRWPLEYRFDQEQAPAI